LRSAAWLCKRFGYSVTLNDPATRHGKTPLADEKKYFRAILKETRESMPAEFATRASLRVESAFVRAGFYRDSQAIVLYSPLGNEVSTDLIFDDAVAAGYAIFYPRLNRASATLELCRVESRSDLAPGAYGILEPATPLRELPPMSAASLPPCVVVVPGLAFTRNGERIGRGGGHYDRLLAELPPHAIKVGLAYSFQLLDQLPQAAWDQRLNFVVTESAIYPAPDQVWRESGLRAQGGNPR
jgi:5-formyltetrahydrofolate cyclo-ligase